jgi:hypothetical protein
MANALELVVGEVPLPTRIKSEIGQAFVGDSRRWNVNNRFAMAGANKEERQP